MWRDRVKIEERINDLLPSEKERSDFLSDKCCRTIEKLKYAERQGVNVTESYFLLSIVYNETMHWRKNKDEVALKQCSEKYDSRIIQLVAVLIGSVSKIFFASSI